MIHPRLCNAKPNFYPRSPCGERRSGHPDIRRFDAISIHALLAESDSRAANCQHRSHQDFYPRSPCGERPGAGVGLYLVTEISIHALLAESDKTKAKANEDRYKFLSTLSLRRATARILLNLTFHQNFYPRSPCGERPPRVLRHCTTYLFLSTLSLRRATVSVCSAGLEH